jgi:peptide-methionine (S)-S-oxide reductase
VIATLWRAVARRAGFALAGGVIACAPADGAAQSAAGGPAGERRLATAVFAAGCFWCSESDFEKVPGVVDAVSGYTGGRVANPTYEQVSSDTTGHREAVQVLYDPARVSYARLLDVFWRNVDPLDGRGQFCDKGEQYTGAIFFATPEERRLAEASKRAIEQAGRVKGRIVTAILPAATFYKAEEYHQSYYKKNPIRYRFYRTNCARDRRLKEVWG